MKLKPLPGRIIVEVAELSRKGSIHLPQGIGVGYGRVVGPSPHYPPDSRVYFDRLQAVPFIDNLPLSEWAGHLVLLWESDILAYRLGPDRQLLSTKGVYLSLQDWGAPSSLVVPDQHTEDLEIVISLYSPTTHYLTSTRAGHYLHLPDADYRIIEHHDLLAELVAS